jgi:hypothetical protein
LNLLQLISKDFSLAHTRIYLLLEYLSSSLEDLDDLIYALVTNAMAFVVRNDALRANVDLVVLTEEPGFLVWMLQAVLFGWKLFVFLFFFLLLLVLL